MKPTLPRRPAYRRKQQRIMWASIGGAVLVLLLVIILGPDRDEVKRRWEFSGEEGPLKVMPELSIDDGADERHQERMRRARELSPPAPNFEVHDPEGEDPTRDIVSPEPDDSDRIDAESEPEWDAYDTVELELPSQTNPCFILRRQVYPRYPADASGVDRSRSQITVKVAFFVDPEGQVGGAYIMSSDGSAPFDDVVLKAVRQWRYEPDFTACASPDGFWNVLTVFFRAPVGP